MKKYTVIIEETAVGEFEVIANTEKEAIEKARERYKNGKLILEPGELQYAQIAVAKPNAEDIQWTEV